MPREILRFTREQLYDLVWSKPMTTIAAEFGMSSVAFAKYCKAADVPRPERGYWRRLSAGQEPKQPRLPKPTPKTQLEVIMEKYQRPSLARRRPPADVARIDVPERIAKLHPIVKELDSLLKPDTKHEDMPTVRGFNGAILKVGPASRKRALRLLHTILGAVEAKGHVPRLGSSTHPRDGDPREFEIVLDGASIPISLREHIKRNPHVRTAQETRYPEWMVPRYDIEPSGQLHLELTVRWPLDTPTMWRDGDKKRLEDCLGEIIWAIGEAKSALAKHRLETAERAREAELQRQVEEERQAEQRRVEAEERRRAAELEALALTSERSNETCGAWQGGGRPRKRFGCSSMRSRKACPSATVGNAFGSGSLGQANTRSSSIH